MLKRTLIFLVLIVFFLTACQSQATPAGTQPDAQETQAFATQNESTGAASPLPAKTEPAGPQATEAVASAANCTVVSRTSTGEDSFPPINDTDWVTGPDTAAMTVFEYSDFQ
jgi:hypothetical protein